MESALYIGRLRHRRFSPVPHEFNYPVVQAFLDTARIPELMRVSPFTSHNRFNWAAYHDRDHRSRAQLAASAAAHGVPAPTGPVFLLTNLRYLGYVFNPVSFFYCPGWVMAEVNNTFGETHDYWVPRRPGARQPKQFHVSPFLSMNQEYSFHFSEPGPTLAVHMDVHERGEKRLDATLTLERREWSAREIHRALIRFPFHTLKVISAIRWQALRLWRKRVPFHSHPGRRRLAA